MEELLINENQSINIAEKEIVEQVKASVKVFSDVLVKSKSYYNLLASESIEAFLREKGLLKGEIVNLRSSMKFLCDFEIADIQLSNLHVDVRAVFDENELFIPKKHFENKILPDIYLFVKMDEDLQNATMLGFVKPAVVNLQNQNDEYYFVNKAILSPVTEFVSLVQSAPEKSQYMISGQAEETVEKLIMLYMDSDIDAIKLEKLIGNLKNSAVAREKLVEFENFERLSAMAIQEFKDLDVENNDFSKYIKALVTTDEFSEFGQDDFASLEEKETPALGLFIDEEPVAEAETEEGVSDEIEEVEGAEETVELSSVEELEEIEEGNDVGSIAAVEVVDEFDMFDVVDEFDMPDAEELPENDSQEVEDLVVETEEETTGLFENSVVNEEEEIQPVVEDLQGEDLELQVEAFSDLASDLDVDNIAEETVEEEIVQENVEVQEISEEQEIVESEVALEASEMSDENSLIDFQEEVVEVQEENFEVVQEEIEEVIDEVPVLEVEENADIISEEIFEEAENVVLEEVQEEISENILDEIQDVGLGGVEEFSEEPIELEIHEEVVIEDVSSVLDENVDEIVEEPLNIEMEEQEDVQLFEEPVMTEEMTLTEDIASFEEISPKEELAPMEDVMVFEEFSDEVGEIQEVVESTEADLGIDISLQEDEVSDIPDVADVVADVMDSGIGNNGVVTQEISFEEEALDGIADIVDNAEVVAENQDEMESFEDVIGQEILETVDAVESVSDSEVDAAVAQAGFLDDEDDLFADEKSAVGKDDDDFSLDDLLAMETDLSVFDDEQSQGGLADDLELGVVSDSFNSDDALVASGASNAQLEELTESAENSDFAFAVDSNKSAVSKKMMVSVAALVTILGLAGAGAWYFLSNSKPVGNVDFANNSTSSDLDLDLDDIVPNENNLTKDIPVSENIVSKQENAKPVQKSEQKPAQKQEQKPAQAAKVPEQAKKSEPVIKPIPEQLTIQKIKKDFSKPNTYLSVSKIVWDVPEYLTYNDDFSSYLQTLGSSVRLNLSSDLLLVNENTLFNKVRVKIELKDSGKKFSAELVDGCGAQVVDNLVLQSVKNTLNQLQPPVNSLDTADEDLFVTIYL